MTRDRSHLTVLGGLLERVAPRALGLDFRWLWSSAALTNLGDGVLLAAGPALIWRSLVEIAHTPLANDAMDATIASP